MAVDPRAGSSTLRGCPCFSPSPAGAGRSGQGRRPVGGQSHLMEPSWAWSNGADGAFWTERDTVIRFAALLCSTTHRLSARSGWRRAPAPVGGTFRRPQPPAVAQSDRVSACRRGSAGKGLWEAGGGGCVARLAAGRAVTPPGACAVTREAVAATPTPALAPPAEVPCSATRERASPRLLRLPAGPGALARWVGGPAPGPGCPGACRSARASKTPGAAALPHTAGAELINS